MLPLELASFFSPLSGCSTHSLLFSRFALLGPYPLSTTLHLALAFLQRKRQQEAAQLDTVKEPHVLILQPSRHKFHAGLVQENDEYLACHGGDPAIASLLESNLELRFLDSMAAFTFFCSAHGSVEAGDVDSPLRLKQTPDLVIACNLSDYLSEKANIGCGTPKFRPIGWKTDLSIFSRTRAGIEVYASLLATLFSAFPTPTQVVLLDNPPDTYKTIPILPSHLNSQLRRKQRADGDNSSPAKEGQKKFIPEPRKMELEKIVEYFCDTVGIITDHGGNEDLNWYEVDIQPIEQHTTGQSGRSEPVRARYAVHKGWDESGYSGRERLSVRF